LPFPQCVFGLLVITWEKINMTVNRERQKVRQEATSIDFNWDTLAQVKKEIDRLIDFYGKDATIRKTTDGWSDREYYGVFIEVDESDAEMNARIAQEEKYAKIQEDHDAKEFERLKNKFGV
jgi:hypothetical protein